MSDDTRTVFLNAVDESWGGTVEFPNDEMAYRFVTAVLRAFNTDDDLIVRATIHVGKFIMERADGKQVSESKDAA